MTARDKFNGIKADFWDCMDSEVLTYLDAISAIEACIESHIDRASPVEVQIREMGPISVEAYRKRQHSTSDLDDAVDRAIDEAREALEDEEHADPNGDHPMFTVDALAKHRPAFEQAVRALAADAKVWQCEVAQSVELTPEEVIEIMLSERPEWFDASFATAGGALAAAPAPASRFEGHCPFDPAPERSESAPPAAEATAAPREALA